MAGDGLPGIWNRKKRTAGLGRRVSVEWPLVSITGEFYAHVPGEDALILE